MNSVESALTQATNVVTNTLNIQTEEESSDDDNDDDRVMKIMMTTMKILHLKLKNLMKKSAIM